MERVGRGVTAIGRSIPAWSRTDVRVRREVVVALALVFVYGFFQQRTGWNENSRLDLVQAMVDGGTIRIDAYHANTGDKAFHDGHYYSDKAPGSALIGVPIYLLLKATHGLAGAAPPDPMATVGALAFVESGLLTVVLVLLLLQFLRPAVGDRWALVMSLGYGLGSIALPFATLFFGHAASTFFLFAAFYHLWRWRVDARARRPVIAGLLAGCAVITEIPVVIGVVVLGAYALWIGRRRAAWFVLGGVPLAVILMAYDWAAFGNPFSIGYQYATIFAAQNAQGILSIVWPSWERAGLILYGPRGLVTYAPWFAFAPFGILALRRPAVRAEVAVSLAICAGFLIYNSGAIDPLGGWTPGPRYLLPALPFATILVALVPTILRPVVAVLMAIATVIFFVATVTMPTASTAVRDPLTDVWLPRLADGRLATTTAGLRWDLDPGASLAILLVVIGATAIVVLWTFRAGRSHARWTAIAAVALTRADLRFRAAVRTLTVRVGRGAGPASHGRPCWRRPGSRASSS